MTNDQPPALGARAFEDLKKTNQHGAEFWSARELQPLPGYSQWRRFEEAIHRAITSCETSGNDPGHHFAAAGKPITGGKDMRDAIKRIGGTLPEAIAQAGYIKSVEKREKAATLKLALDEKDALGLLGDASGTPKKK